jgi:hypothetical protein
MVTTGKKNDCTDLKLDIAWHHREDRSFQTAHRKNANDHSMKS